VLITSCAACTACPLGNEFAAAVAIVWRRNGLKLVLFLVTEFFPVLLAIA
jgi:hypothetical protein